MKPRWNTSALLLSLFPVCGCADPVYRQTSCVPVGEVIFLPDFGRGPEPGRGSRFFDISLINRDVAIHRNASEFTTSFETVQFVFKAGESDKEGALSVEVSHGAEGKSFEFGILTRDCWNDLESKYSPYVRFKKTPF